MKTLGMKFSTLTLLVLVTACGAGESREAMVTSDSAGIRIVESAFDQPAWRRTGIWELSATPRLQLGNRLGDPDQQLFRVRHARRLPDGRIVVANTGLGDVRIFDDTGMLVTTLSMPMIDDDPIAPIQVHELPGDSVLVIGGDRSLSVFGPDGGLARRSQLADPGDGLAGDPRPTGRFDDGTLLFRANLPDDPEATGTGRRSIRLFRYARDGQLLEPYGDFEDQALLFADRGAWIFGPSAQHAIADSTVWYGTAERFEIREMGREGGTIRVFRLDRPAVMVTQSDISTYTSAASREMSGQMAAIDSTLQASVFADTFPAYDRILVDDQDNVWVRNYQWFDIGSGYAWTVFDSTGRYLGQVRTPSLLEIYQIGPDFVLGRMATNTGREAVYVYRLIKPESGAEDNPPGS